jgi:uncharacterized protein (TIGR03437 family)
MTFTYLRFSAAALFLAAAWAQPQVVRVMNNYSFIFPGVPNYGIAQGSIFDIFGYGLATTTSLVQNVPLPTALDGVSAQVSVNGVTTTPIIYFISPNQIAAILPSATPVGRGKITVTVNGQTSDPGAITVVQSAFGLLAINGAVDGPATVEDANSQLLGLTNAANPGDYVTLWGSGLGPVTGDETVLQAPVDLSGIPIEVDIGGVSATIQYHGRSVYPGLDQINVVVPSGVFGCHVPVVVRYGDIVSNFLTIPVAQSGNVCSEAETDETAGEIATLMSQPGVNRGTINFTNSVGGPSNFATIAFTHFTNAQYAAKEPGGLASLGTCTVYNFSSGMETSANPIQGKALNAGPSIHVTTPGGASADIPYQNGGYSGQPSGGNGGSLHGTYTFTGSGGSDVGAFKAQINVPGGLSAFKFSTPNNPTGMIRSQGLTVTWTQPGSTDPTEFVQISGSSNIIADITVGAAFYCNVPLSAGQFTVPPAVLLALPPQPSGAALAIGNSSLEVDLVVHQTFSAPGLDVAFINFTLQNIEAFQYE